MSERHKGGIIRKMADYLEHGGSPVLEEQPVPGTEGDDVSPKEKPDAPRKAQDDPGSKMMGPKVATQPPPRRIDPRPAQKPKASPPSESKKYSWDDEEEEISPNDA